MSLPADELPRNVYSVADVRRLDRLASERGGIPGYELMCRAGAAALAVLRRRWPGAKSLAIVCGAGNNAGDGLVVARLAKAAGFSVRVLAVVPADRWQGDAGRAAADCAAAGIAAEPFRAEALAGADVIVDGLLGIGVDRPVTGAFLAAIEAINASGRPVLALDIPSGLDGDTGRPHGAAVRATATVTFVGLKPGLFLGVAVDDVGGLELASLDVPSALAADLEPQLIRLTMADLLRLLPRRPRSAHKGSSGRLLLVGGGPGMAGAIRLAAEAALRVGAGLVYVATHPDNVAAVLAGRPEIICRGVTAVSGLDDWLDTVDAAVLGPGLGQTPWARVLHERLLAASLPLVVDADALNLLAAAPGRRDRWVLTPHPGEAARLLGSSTGAIQHDRIGAVRELASRYGAVAVLKGANTLVATPDARDPPRVCDRGNPGMASAGMGDVLSGVIGSLLVQTGDLTASARAGVLLHALAGDAAARDGERGTLASDLFPHLRRWANPS
ncbi:MAG TPA: NAD(P)H-hydrate dehydratase [Gammaproteobacteria bacterium]|jgi:NAD(P)H-hydrate epimerase|nr:NAD(P)H-hydrate dehydratase [Gammaproteobacteria bacterium]